ncbi:thioesterase [Novosphingobium sp. PC22D]|uniref:YbgC/FadM family acyl-CoA thioesterase n=1 Tax=Novosphingobium sp. PC22D TaxID=1962403 RepID=UPI000BF1FB43|nr:YbgC/FadM family acyl-CoA thioesterase [Novosphingobium sp. PC22D]PEQ11918.1 thioesterase [Novosphingobium sp. PC22D]
MTTFPQPATGAIDGDVHRYAVRVYYEDTDAGGVVYHANYLRWFERARTDLLILLGVDQRRALEAGEGGYAVSEASIRYLAPARLGDIVRLETVAETVRRVYCVLRQSAWREATKLSEASFRVGFIGPDGRPRPQPEAWLRAFAAFQAVPKGHE